MLSGIHLLPPSVSSIQTDLLISEFTFMLNFQKIIKRTRNTPEPRSLQSHCLMLEFHRGDVKIFQKYHSLFIAYLYSSGSENEREQLQVLRPERNSQEEHSSGYHMGFGK